MEPPGVVDDAAPSADYAERHQDFSRAGVHLLGAIEGVAFADRHGLDDERGDFLEATVEAAEELLERHEGFPPHPGALEDPDEIAGWQDAMSRLRSAAAAIADSGGEGADAGSRVGDLREAYREAGRFSGYPSGTFAFLEWRGVHKMARDLDSDLRLRLVEDVIERFEEGRDRFVEERRPLIPADDLPEFDRRVETLLENQIASVREPGPIADSTALVLHQHYPFFHRPDVLARLLKREGDRQSLP